MTVNEKITALRVLLTSNKFDAYLIPSSDPHQSEYVAEHWSTRTWLSGFTGSAGTVIITSSHAGLWTDSRYFLQAEDELASSEMVLHPQQVPHAPEHLQWLLAELPEGATVACDGNLFSIAQIRGIERILAPKNIKLDYQKDLPGEIWKDRPNLPKYPFFEHEVKYAGMSRGEKLTQIRTEMKAQGANYHLVSTLDNIAWIFNIRSNDVDCNPVTIAYAVIGEREAFLFIDEAKVPAALRTSFAEDGIRFHPYDGLEHFLGGLSESILLNPTTTSVKAFNSIRAAQLIEGTTISMSLKAIKNEVEVGHIKDAMVKDGVALTKLYRWLETELDQREIPETEIAEQLAGFRKSQGDYHGESFAAIVGYQGNGAIVHYRAEEGKCAMVKKEGILLLDSGGQYLNGTTDITRTTALGAVTAEQKQHYTLVLKGHIALAKMQFPRGTVGIQLDAIARQYLWEEALNYGHGTGHGVGFFLNVHEAPQGFAASTTTSRGKTALVPGMFTSNEPGFYKTGAYGIRIENLVLTREAVKNEFGDFLKFETLTLFPIDQSLIEKSMLTPREINWLNDYHALVFEKLAPAVDASEKAWLKEKCAKL
ncbi:MAG: aminopeptidase P family N-terminal domain-containing protein [Saprospiraceae bacterium]